jgi:SAM-dependent methyltransferase
VSTDRAALVEKLRQRANGRRAEGELEMSWLGARAVEETPATAVDALLRMSRPLLDRAAAPASPGRLGGWRKRLARLLTVSRGKWHREQKEFEVLLREAIVWLAVATHRSLEVQGSLQTEARAQREWMEELVGTLHDRVAYLENRRRADALERTRERSRGASTEGAGSGGGIPRLDDFDYLAFENRFRGPVEIVRERQRRHAARFAGTDFVADLGCGRGEFLELLRDQGVTAIGVDASAEMVAIAREKGLTAEHGDLFDFLEQRPEGSLGGILCSHVVEHMWPADHVRLLRLCAASLKPGGLLIVETPNPKSLVAGSANFSCDPTHLRPVFPETLAFMAESAGFEEPQIEYLSPVPRERRAGPLTGVPTEFADLGRQIDESIARLDGLVFGEQEYALISRRGS